MKKSDLLLLPTQRRRLLRLALLFTGLRQLFKTREVGGVGTQVVFQARRPEILWGFAPAGNQDVARVTFGVGVRWARDREELPQGG